MLALSEIESEIFDLKVGASNLEDIKAEDLTRFVFSNHLDLLKIHVNAERVEIFNFLDKLGFPYQSHYGGLTIGAKIGEHLNSLNVIDEGGFSYYLYNKNEHFAAMYQCVLDSMSDVYDYYFDSSLFRSLIPREKYLEVQANYACSFDNNDHPNKYGYIGIDGDGNVKGFYLLDILGHQAKAYMGGVVPKYRGYKVGHDGYVKIMKDVLLPMGVNDLSLDVHVQNIANINTASLRGNGLTPRSSFLKINVFPLLSRSDIPPICLAGVTLQSILEYLQDVQEANSFLKEIKTSLSSAEENIFLTKFEQVRITKISTDDFNMYILLTEISGRSLSIYLKYVVHPS